jgi:alpha-tubulin suppressor-like RCC1 family protein
VADGDGRWEEIPLKIAGKCSSKLAVVALILGLILVLSIVPGNAAERRRPGGQGAGMAWGINNFGQLGDNTTTERHTPVQIKGPGSPGYLEDVVALAAGALHGLALKSDGTVWAWGYNPDGRLGDNTTTDRLTPVQVKGPEGVGYLTGVVAIAAGSSHSLALLSDGTVWAWGENNAGQLGDNTATERHAPVQVKGKDGDGYLTGVVGISAGSQFTLACTSAGSAWGWGSNWAGQLGDNTNTIRHTPVKVLGTGGVGYLAGVVAVAAGDRHSLALISDGSVQAWGHNEFGMLGDGTTTSSSTPVPVHYYTGSGYLTGAVAIAGGGNHSLALIRDGTVQAWGLNNSGQLGDNTTNESHLPVWVKGPGGVDYLGGATAISAGGEHSLALLSDGTLRAWGSNGNGQLGDNTTDQRNTPVQVLGPGASGNLEKVTAIAAGASAYSLAAVDSNGPGATWGGNEYGQLGDNTTIQRNAPVHVLGLGGSGYLTGAVGIAGGGEHSLALLSDGTLRAWGLNNSGQLGDNTTDQRNTPVQVVLDPAVPSYLTGVKAIAAGVPDTLITHSLGTHSIALTSDGTVWTWGRNDYGQLGDNTVDSRPTPVQVLGPGGAGNLTGVTAIAAGYDHSMALNAPNPTPAITDLSPDHKKVKGAAFPLTVNGTGFVPGVSKVKWNNAEYTPTSYSATQLSITVPAEQLTTAGTVNITVFNPSPGGGTSNSKTFTVENPAPTITTLYPDHKTAGDAGFTLTVTGTGFVNGSKVKWNGSDVTTTYVSSTKLTTSIPASDIKTAGTAKVTVFNPGPGGGTSNAKTLTINEKPEPPEPPEPPVNPKATWYLAEGSTAYGFDCYITIQNPNTTPVTAQVTYMTGSGPVSAPDVNLPAKSQATVNPKELLGNQDFSTRVVCKEGKAIAVDRTMSWTGEGASSPEAHSSIGVNAPARTWYLPEGSTNWNFETWLLIQNPNATEASCSVTYMIEGKGPQTVNHKVPANSRESFSMEKDIGKADASIKVEADIPVIPERAMYRNSRREGHDSIGTTAPDTSFYLAEGTTNYGFTTYVLIQNPNAQAADVTVTYMTTSGPKPQAPFTMDPNSRETIRVNDVEGMGSTDFSTAVEGSKPIIAERAMYWDNGTGEACHDSVGMASSHTSFFLPDGQTSEGVETYTLVQNPNSSPVTVEISYLTPDGKGNVVFTETIGANSRQTFNMADKGISGRAAVMVTSKTAGKKIMCERAMYWNSRGAGTDTIGGFSD